MGAGETEVIQRRAASRSHDEKKEGRSTDLGELSWLAKDLSTTKRIKKKKARPRSSNLAEMERKTETAEDPIDPGGPVG